MALRVRRGRAPLLIIAPHGGRRHPSRRPWTSGALRVNDLHTADLAFELADRLDADAIVNDEIDRNDLDLNRITQIRARAPWFLDTVADHLEALWQRHGAALAVLFVHGWNVADPACDIGLGAPLDHPASAPSPLAPATRPALAVDDAFLVERVGTLRRACAARGISTGLGWRYPASSPGNLLQLFTRRYHADPDPRLGRLARLGEHINAVQLELGIPLRFTCAWRTRFIEACVETFADGREPTHPPRAIDQHASLPAMVDTTSGLTRRLAMQFHHLGGGVAGLIACDVGPKGASARLLLLPDDGGLYFFTGEAPSALARDGVRIGPLGLRPEAPGALALRFTGPMLRFADTSPFLDLEVGLVGARIRDVALDLRCLHAHGSGRQEAPDAATSAWPFERARGGFGRVSGWITGLEAARGPEMHRASAAAAVTYELSGHGFLDGRDATRGASTLSCSLPGAPAGALRIVVPRHGHPVAHRYRDAACEALTVASFCLEEPRQPITAPPFSVTLQDAAGREVAVRGTPGASIPVIRQLPRGRTTRYELAFCRYAVDGADAGAGWTEISVATDGP